MIKDSFGKVLVCFHENRNVKEIGVTIFLPDNDFEVIYSNIFIKVGYQIVLLRSAVSSN